MDFNPNRKPALVSAVDSESAVLIPRRERKPLPIAEMMQSYLSMKEASWLSGNADGAGLGAAPDKLKLMLVSAVKLREKDKVDELADALKRVSPLARFALLSPKVLSFVDTIEAAMDDGFITTEMIESFDLGLFKNE